MPVTYKTYGAQAIREMEAAILKATNKSGSQVLKTLKSTIDVDTGRSKREAYVSDAKIDGDEIVVFVGVPTPYAIFQELRKKALRRALASNGTISLKNFENII